MKFDCHVSTHVDGSPVLKLSGTLDLSNITSLRNTLRDYIEEGHKRLIVDLDELDYLDSSGLGVLVGALARMREKGGELPLVVSESKHRRVFDVTKLSYVFSLHSDIREVM